VIGDVLWIIAYILAIRKGFQEKTYGIPMMCIALNLSGIDLRGHLPLPERHHRLLTLGMAPRRPCHRVPVVSLRPQLADNALMNKYFYPLP